MIASHFLGHSQSSVSGWGGAGGGEEELAAIRKREYFKTICQT